MKTYKQQQKEKYIRSKEIVNKGFRTTSKRIERVVERERLRILNEETQRMAQTWNYIYPSEPPVKDNPNSQFKVGDSCFLNIGWYKDVRVTITGFYLKENLIECVYENGLHRYAEERDFTKIVKKKLSPEMLEMINEIDPYGEDIWDE